MTDIFKILAEPAPVIHNNGTKKWFNKDGQLHRDGDQPAVIWADGTRLWYRDGGLYRDHDKPVVMARGKSMAWYMDKNVR